MVRGLGIYAAAIAATLQLVLLDHTATAAEYRRNANTGGKSCEAGTVHLSYDECEEAAQQLGGGAWRGRPFGGYEFSKAQGCYFQIDHYYAAGYGNVQGYWYNSYASGANADSDEKIVCRVIPTTITTTSVQY